VPAVTRRGSTSPCTAPGPTSRDVSTAEVAPRPLPREQVHRGCRDGPNAPRQLLGVPRPTRAGSRPRAGRQRSAALGSPRARHCHDAAAPPIRTSTGSATDCAVRVRTGRYVVALRGLVLPAARSTTRGSSPVTSASQRRGPALLERVGAHRRSGPYQAGTDVRLPTVLMQAPYPRPVVPQTSGGRAASADRDKRQEHGRKDDRRGCEQDGPDAEPWVHRVTPYVEHCREADDERRGIPGAERQVCAALPRLTTQLRCPSRWAGELHRLPNALGLSCYPQAVRALRFGGSAMSAERVQDRDAPRSREAAAWRTTGTTRSGSASPFDARGDEGTVKWTH
jgi:hypothetical protein